MTTMTVSSAFDDVEPDLPKLVRDFKQFLHPIFDKCYQVDLQNGKQRRYRLNGGNVERILE